MVYTPRHNHALDWELFGPITNDNSQVITVQQNKEV